MSIDYRSIFQGRAPMPQANMMQQYQTPQGVTPIMALRRPINPQILAAQRAAQATIPTQKPVVPAIDPMLARVAANAAKMRQAQAAQTAPAGAAQAGVSGAGAGAGAGGLPSSLSEAIGADLMSPTGQAITQASLAGLAAGGWSPTPVTFGQGIAAMGQAGMKGYAEALKAAQDKRASEAEIKYKEAKTKAELAAAGAPYAGSSITAQDRSTILTVAPKIQNGTATAPEIARYNLAYQSQSKPRTEQRTAPDGTVTTVSVPGMDLSGFPTPAGLTQGERVIGTQEPKFNNDEKLAGAFAGRMIEATQTFENVTAGGYDPSNFQDYAASQLPMALRAIGMTESGQRYLAAKMNFITAVLRKESGAAISATEFETEDMKYFPQPGESAATIEQKRIARQTAIDAMKAQSGGAFDYLQKRMAPSDVSKLPKGSVFMKREGGVSFYKTPDGKIMAVD